MPSSPNGSQGTVGYYSILRYVPDAVRAEAVNVGLFLVDQEGSWSRFDGEVPKGVFRSLRRSDDVAAVETWIKRTKEVFAPVGSAAILPAGGKIDLSTLERWHADFGGSLQLTTPTIAVGQRLDVLWDQLYARLVSRAIRQASTLEVAAVPAQQALSATDERVRLSSALIRTMRKWENFDPQRVHKQGLFLGRNLMHHVDVAVFNHKVTAIAKALPVVHGSDEDLIASRALLVDAALDLDPDVIKLAIHDEAPPDREEVLAANKLFLEDVSVVVVARHDFAGLEARFSAQFFP